MNLRTTALSLSVLAALAIAPTACRGTPPPMYDAGTPLYTRVGMHFDLRRGVYEMYTTNYVGVPHFLPPNTELTYEARTRSGIELSDAEGNRYRITHQRRHTPDFDTWVDKCFSTQPVELPGSLTEQELEAIAAGRVEEGMSREAVLLAWGYPPATLVADPYRGPLQYDRMRMSRGTTITFDDQDRVVSVGR